jgi:hypothetical protein
MRLLRRVRRSLPDDGVAREEPDRRAAPGTRGDHDVCLLRRRLLLQGGNAGRNRRAHGSEPRRPREPGPCVCEGPLCIRLRDAPRSHIEAHDPREDLGSLARGHMGRSDRLRCGRRRISYRSSCEPHSGTTTWIPVRACVIRLRVMASNTPLANRPARKRSHRSCRPMSCC